MDTSIHQTGAGTSAAHGVKIKLTGDQKDVIKSFDSREAVIERQVELINLLKRLVKYPKAELEELAAINVYLNTNPL